MRKEIPSSLKNRLKNLHYTSAECILHELDQGDGFFIRVVGDPDNGCYEWVIERPKDTPYTKLPAIEFSDAGYGDSDIALRDGLIAYFGLPTKVKQAVGRDSVEP